MSLGSRVGFEERVDVVLHLLGYFGVVLKEALQRKVECFFEEFFLEVGVAFD